MTLEKLWALEEMLKGPAPEAPEKVRVLEAGVKLVMFQLPPTVMASEAEAVRAPASLRFAPTLRFFPPRLRVAEEIVRELVLCTSVARLPPLLSVKL